MVIGTVIGNVWATRKEESLNGHKLLIVKPIEYRSSSSPYPFVAVDNIGAGIGETVLVVQGSSARKAVNDQTAPIDATIVGIVDQLELNEDV